jgi:hypothetical protein
MRSSPGHDFFERAVTIHRYDCSLVADATETADTRPDADEAASLMPDDRSVRYGLAARSSYDGLRRLIGQLAGLAILLTASRRRDILDLPDLPLARERWQDIGTGIAALDAPPALARHFGSLTAAYRLVGDIITGLASLSTTADAERVLDIANDSLKRAYRVLQDASEPRLGMTMVDFNHACCNCGRR